MKYLIWLVIALAVVVWLRRIRKSIVANATAARGPVGARRSFAYKQKKEQAETMLQCTQCGIYFPASESVTDHTGMVFCSTEHLRLASF